jgi:hypothetical protein
MTVSSGYEPNSSTGNGITTVFAYNFRILAAADLEVTIDGVVQTLTTHYSVSGVGADGGGNVTFVTAPPTDTVVIRRRKMALVRTTDYQDNGDLLADVLNPDQDAAVLMLQQVQEELDRSVKFPLGDSADTTMPTVEERAGKVLVFDDDGNVDVGEDDFSDLADAAAASASAAASSAGSAASSATNAAQSTAQAEAIVLGDFLQDGDDAVPMTFPEALRLQGLMPEQFGAVGDGTTDDTAALRAWALELAATSKPGRCRNATYRVAETGNGITLPGLRGTVIDFNGATFKTNDGYAVTNNQGILYFTDCQDCEFRNLIADANRSTRTPAETSNQSIKIGPNCERLKFRNVRSINAVVDGWYVWGNNGAALADIPTDVTLEDCTAETAYRNGASIITSNRLRIIRGRYVGTTGTAPEAGIDWEPNSTDPNGNIDMVMVDVETSDNDGYGTTFGGNYPTSGRVRGLRGGANGEGLLQVSSTSGDAGLIIDGTEILDHTTLVRGAVDIASSAVNVTLRNTKTDGITCTFTGAEAVVYVHSDADQITIDGLEARNISVIALLGRSPAMVARNIQVEDCTSSTGAVYISSAAARACVTDVRTARTTAYGLYVEAPNTVVDNVYCEDSDSTVAAIRFTSTATGSAARGLRVHETTSIPVGAYAARVDCVLSELDGLVATGGYTSSNVLFSATANFLGVKARGVSPDPFAVTFTYDPASLASGAGATRTDGLALANFGDGCVVHPPYDLQGILASASVSATGTVRLALFNPTGGAIDLASGSWTISLKKS